MIENNKILENVKLKISISNFANDEKILYSSLKKEKISFKNNRKKFLKFASAACFIFAMITGITFAKEIQNFMIDIKNKFGANASNGVQTAVENDYIEKVNLDYINSDGLQIAVDSFLMDDYNFDINFKIKINDKYNVEEMPYLDLTDLKIVDENNNIIFIAKELEQQMYEKKDDKIYEPIFWNGYGYNIEEISKNECIIHLAVHATEEHKIPKSKKLYITLSNVNVRKKSNAHEHSDINCEGNWNFELDVPEEFYNRENIIYKATSSTDKGIDVNTIQAKLSNTALKIYIPVIKTNKIDFDLLQNREKGNVSDMIAIQKEYVETSDGRTFEIAGRSDGDGGYSIESYDEKVITNYHQTFNLTKFDTTDEIKVHLFTNKKEEIIIKLNK